MLLRRKRSDNATHQQQHDAARCSTMQHYDVLACPAASFACRRVLTTGRAPRLAAAVREKVSAEVSASVWQSSCFYAHRNADGTLAEAPELRTALTAEGRGEVIREVSKYSSTAAVSAVRATLYSCGRSPARYLVHGPFARCHVHGYVAPTRWRRRVLFVLGTFGHFGA